MKIIHDQEQKRFYTEQDNKRALLDYKQIDETTLKYYHTFVPPELRGKKFAAEIVRYALDYAQEHDFQVIPSCPYVRKFIERHQEYQSLVQ
ncbi:MAG: GNAT family N-acetyltransferase [Candidatus Cloacimonadales bacterium]